MIIQFGGVVDSAETTLLERCASMFSSNNEIRAIVEDWGTTLGGLNVGLDSCDILLNICSKLMQIQSSSVEKLEDL